MSSNPITEEIQALLAEIASEQEKLTAMDNQRTQMGLDGTPAAQLQQYDRLVSAQYDKVQRLKALLKQKQDAAARIDEAIATSVANGASPEEATRKAVQAEKARTWVRYVLIALVVLVLIYLAYRFIIRKA